MHKAYQSAFNYISVTSNDTHASVKPYSACSQRIILTNALCLCLFVPGTDATHAEHIETIKTRNYVGVQPDGGFVPGELGMGLVEGKRVCVCMFACGCVCCVLCEYCKRKM